MIPPPQNLPKIQGAAKSGYGNLQSAVLPHVAFFGLSFNFCGGYDKRVGGVLTVPSG
jgi:hypothetical protein